MRRVVLARQLTTSALGFGCASLMGSVGRRASAALLEEALDGGVTHFDAARLYGYGEAEAALGRFLARRRDAVTVATKVGIAPPELPRGATALRALARPVLRAAPALRGGVRSGFEGSVARHAFDAAALRGSFEQSLRKLRTDHVDLLLLHDCTRADVSDAVLAFLQRCREEGSARACGIATSVADAEAVLRDLPGSFDVVQVPDRLLGPAPRAGAPGSPGLVTHSVLRQALPALQEQSAGGDLPGPLAPLLVGLARRRNPAGTVLVSSRDRRRLRELLQAPDLPDDVAGLLEGALRGAATPT